MHILHNILRSKGNQKMKFGQVIEYNNRAKNATWKLVPDLFLFAKGALYELKASGLQLSFNVF